jgi:hypothetical protein
VVVVGGGAETATLAVAVADPPSPVQLKLYVEVALNAPVETDPLAALTPLQAPEAVQEAVFVELQVRVLEPPAVRLVGEALRETVGAGLINAGP